MMIGESEESCLHRNADNLRSTAPDDSTPKNVAEKLKQRLSIEERLTIKMFFYAREIICFFLAITFTALAALHSSSPKVSKPPSAKPFFNQTSLVLDFYKGHLGAMIERVTEADYSFVMYYAPWDAQSQAIREEFEKVTQYYHTQIFFAAINCWHPNSECRGQYNKILSYPVLMMYPSKDSGIQYRGIETAPYMIRFIHNVMNPIVRVTHKAQLTQLLIEHDAVVLGFFDFIGLANSPGYREFYKASLRSLERDPNRELAFAVLSKGTARLLDMDMLQYPSLKLLMWNESLSYPEDYEWTSENIVNWISSSIHQPVLWLQPPGNKALTLAPYLREGPVLFLFTPRNPFHPEKYNYNYNLLKEVSLHYVNCAENPIAHDIESRLRDICQTATQRYAEKTKRCVATLGKDAIQLTPPKEAALNIDIQQWVNNTCCDKVILNKCLLHEKALNNPNAKTCIDNTRQSERVCRNVDIFKVFGRKSEPKIYEVCCNNEHSPKKLHSEIAAQRLRRHLHSPVVSTEIDPQSPESVRQHFIKEDCRMWLTGNEYQQAVFPQIRNNYSNVNLTRSVCKMNKTLALIAIDSLHFFHFAEALGIDVLKKKDKTAAIIVDATQESQFILQEELSRHVLIEFINNYTEGSIRRTLRSENSRRFAKKYRKDLKCSLNRKKLCVPELTSETFLATVLDPTKDVVVMYHSPYCAFCSAIAHVYLTVAHYLEKMDHLLFVRIDGDNNDLPWEYNMDRFPSILFFPARRKEDSTVFPFSLPITIPNLINFILSNLDGVSRVEALTNICRLRTAEEPRKCTTWIRMLCLNVIEQLLNDYRRLSRHAKFLDKLSSNYRRQTILIQLNHIKTVHLLLTSTSNLVEDQEKVQLIVEKFKLYYTLIRRLQARNKVDSLRRPTNNEVNLNISERDTVKDEL